MFSPLSVDFRYKQADLNPRWAIAQVQDVKAHKIAKEAVANIATALCFTDATNCVPAGHWH